jgi:hypothetical protein
MFYLIGTDEAGYGPNLGPLVITASVWRLDGEDPDADLYRLLRGVVRSASSKSSGRWLHIADSKQLYQPGGGLALLEEGVLSALFALGQFVETWREAWRCLAPTCSDDLSQDCWYQDFDRPLPGWAPKRRIKRLAERLVEAGRRSGLDLIGLQSRVLFPEQLNEAWEQYQSKGEVLSRATLELVHWACALADGHPCRITCDKHGGRNHYGPLLHDHLPGEFIWTLVEGTEESRYRWGDHEIAFCTRGERSLPTALASMVSKYLRELAMQAFNAYWQQLLPGLRPTAGYPGDARRFYEQIEPLLSEMAISRQRVWRNR